MRKHPVALCSTLVLTLAFSPLFPAFAANPPAQGQQDTEVACAGLASPVKHKNLGKNLPARKKDSNTYCGDPAKEGSGGSVGQELKRIMASAAKCEGALKKTVSPNFSIMNLTKKSIDRLAKACIQVRSYNVFSAQLCADYGKNAESTKAVGGADVDSAIGRGSFEAIANMRVPLMKNYQKMAADSEEEAKDFDRRLAGIANDRDKVIGDEIEFIKKALKFNTDKAKQLVEAEFKERQKLSGEGEGLSETRTIRFRNCRRGESQAACRADPTSVGGFYAALDSCNALSRDGGQLDKWRDNYNKNISKEVGEMKQEAKAFHAMFSDMAADHQRVIAQVRSRAGNSTVVAQGGNLSPSEARQAIRAGSSWSAADLKKAGMVNSGRFNEGGVDYVVYRRPASAGSPSSWLRNGRIVAVPATKVE